jgi:hypothetical protein
VIATCIDYISFRCRKHRKNVTKEEDSPHFEPQLDRGQAFDESNKDKRPSGRFILRLYERRQFNPKKPQQLAGYLQLQNVSEIMA